MTKNKTLYTLKEKIYQWSSKLDNIGESLPNNDIDKERFTKNPHGEDILLDTTIHNMNRRLTNMLGNETPTFVVKRQAKNVFGFACACYIIFWYLTLLDQGIQQTFYGIKYTDLSNTSFFGFHVSYWFTSLIAPVFMVIGAFAHFDLKTGVVGSKLSNDESMSQAAMFERMGFVALLMNIYGGWLDASVIINLTTIPSTIQGYIGFGLSWLAVLYFTKTLGARFGLVYFTR
jgi:hypothetical protein